MMLFKRNNKKMLLYYLVSNAVKNRTSVKTGVKLIRSRLLLLQCCSKFLYNVYIVISFDVNIFPPDYGLGIHKTDLKVYFAMTTEINVCYYSILAVIPFLFLSCSALFWKYKISSLFLWNKSFTFPEEWNVTSHTL